MTGNELLENFSEGFVNISNYSRVYKTHPANQQRSRNVEKSVEQQEEYHPEPSTEQITIKGKIESIKACFK